MLRGIEIICIGISAVLQGITAYLALRMISLSYRKFAWGLIFVGLMLMSVLNVVRLAQIIWSPAAVTPYHYQALVELCISVAFLIGTILIRPLFTRSRRMDDMYQLFVQKSAQGLVIYQNGRIIFANPAFAYLAGHTIEDLLNMHDNAISMVFHAIDRDNVMRTLHADGLETPSQKREIRILNKRGMIFWLETFFSRTIYNGRPAVQITFINITDRKRIEQDLHESERRHRIISQLTSDFIYSASINAENQVQIDWVSGAYDRITGYTFEDMQIRDISWVDLCHQDDKLKSVEAYTYALSNQPVVIEYRIISRHGEVVWLRDYLQPIWNEVEKRVTHIVGAVQDITDRKVAENALKESEARWRGLAENAPTIIATLDVQHRVLWMNRPISRPVGEVVGKDFHSLLPSSERGKFHRALRTVFTNALPQQHEIQISAADGQPSWYEVIVGPIRQEEQVTSAILVMTNISERKKAEEQLKFLSNHDVLTGLFNRAFFEAELRRLQNSRLYPVTVVMMDVNNLKNTNDVYGHAAGDELLRTISQVMRESFRSEDVVSRIGGDEFAILLPSTDAESAQAILKRLNEKLEAMNAQHREIDLSLSIGAATGDQDSILVDVMKLADNLMYEDKARQKSSPPPDEG
jgi:diguanylate cyclase (GGDEF)-like protein/PAS domain S-box-containing protein